MKPLDRHLDPGDDLAGPSGTAYSDDALLSACAELIARADPPPAFAETQACALFAWDRSRRSVIRR